MTRRSRSIRMIAGESGLHRQWTAYLEHGKFVPVSAVPGGQVHFIAGDKGQPVAVGEQQPFTLSGRTSGRTDPLVAAGPSGKCLGLLSDPIAGGLWAGFWRGGGVSYFKDGRLRASYTAANGLGANAVADLQLDRSGALWAATEGGGLSRVKDGRIARLTTTNGLPCNTVHWTMRQMIIRSGCTRHAAWCASPDPNWTPGSQTLSIRLR